MLKEIATPVHIKEFKGQTLAVDAYVSAFSPCCLRSFSLTVMILHGDMFSFSMNQVWLHKGAYGCAEELAMGQTTVKYVELKVS